MKALLLKDYFTLKTQLRLFSVLIVIFSLVPSTFQNCFAIIFAALLPYTAIAYDERSKWDRMAAVMPYSTRDIVLGKYISGMIFFTFALIIGIVANIITGGIDNLSANIAMLLTAFCGAFLTMDISLPLMFRFGVEKSRIIMFLMVFLVCFVPSSLEKISSVINTEQAISEAIGMIVVFSFSIVITIISIWISIRIYTGVDGRNI